MLTSLSPEDLRELLDIDESPHFPARFNIAPSQPIAVVREPQKLELLRWGLILSGALSGAKGGARGINVRVESVARAPAYRDSFYKRRCLIIVDGFYEWKKESDAKTPFAIRRADHKPFALAGIWDHGANADGVVIETCAVITGPARGVLADIHDRMPLIVPKAGFARWLDPKVRDVSDLLVTDASTLVAYAVDPVVNSPANDDARCIEPATASQKRGNLSLF